MAKVSFPVAADTSYLLRLAEGDEDAWDALEILRRTFKQCRRIATVTVLRELAHHAGNASNLLLAETAHKALRSLRGQWGFEPGAVQFPLNEDQVEALARDFLRRGLLPESERHDAHILAEATCSKALLLVSEDSHLHDVDDFQLSLCLRRWKLTPPSILTARELVKTFGH